MRPAAATTPTLFSDEQNQRIGRLGLSTYSRGEVERIYAEAKDLYVSGKDKYILDGIFNQLLSSPSRDTFETIDAILRDHRTALEQDKRVTTALQQMRASDHNPGAIDVIDFAEQERRDIVASGDVGVGRSSGPRTVMKDDILPGISRSAIESIKNEYTPHSSGEVVAGNLRHAIGYASFETKKELKTSKARVEHFITTGNDLDADEIKKRRNDVPGRFRRFAETNAYKAITGLHDIVHYWTRGIISESSVKDDNWYRNEHIPKRNELICQLLSKLDPGSSNYAAIEKAVNDATAGKGDILDQESFQELQTLIGEELVRTGKASREEMQRLNEQLAELNKAVLEGMKEHVSDADAMMKYRYFQLMLLVTPFGALGAFNYLDEFTHIFGPLFSNGAFSEGFAQFLRNLPFGVGDLVEILRIDDFFEMALDNVPVVKELGETVDALTDNSIFQGAMQTAAPMQSSPLTMLAIAGVASLFRTKSEIAFKEKREKFNEAHDKRLEQTLEAFEKGFHAREEKDIGNYVQEKTNVLKQAEGRAQAADFVFEVKSLDTPAGVADGYNKRVMDLIFDGIATDPSKTGGVRRTVWDIVGDDAINDPEKIAKAFRGVNDDNFRVEVRRRFLRYKGIEDDLRKQGYDGNELKAKALEKMCIISAACKCNAAEDDNYDLMMVAQNVMEIAERGNGKPEIALRRPGIFGSEYAAAVEHINSAVVIGPALRNELAALPNVGVAGVNTLFDRIAVMSELRDSNAEAYNGIVKAYNDSVAAGKNFNFDQALLEQKVASNPSEVRKIAEKRRETERRRSKEHIFKRVNREFDVLGGGIDDFQRDDVDSLQKEMVEASLAKRELRGQALVEQDLVYKVGKKHAVKPYESNLTKVDLARESAAILNSEADCVAKISLRPEAGVAPNYRIFGDNFTDRLRNIAAPEFRLRSTTGTDTPLPKSLTYSDLDKAINRATPNPNNRAKDMATLRERALIISGLYHNNREVYDKMINLSTTAAPGAFDFDAALGECGITPRMAENIRKQEEKDVRDLDRLNRGGSSPVVKRVDLSEIREEEEKRRAVYTEEATDSLRTAMTESLIKRSAGGVSPPGPDPMPLAAERFAALRPIPVATKA